MERKRAPLALTWIVVSLAAVTAQEPSRPGDRVVLLARPFPLTAVRLLDGPFRDAMLRDQAYLLELDQDRLLHTFRLTAGLPTTATPLGGWEAPDVELRGHTAGHYLSAVALMYAATGDPRFKQRGDAMVAELAKIQIALGAKGFNPGYLSAFPEELIDRVEARQRVWAPYYTLHKMLAGLLDMHQLCDNQQALDVLLKQVGWVRMRMDRLTPDAQQAMLQTEFGGMNDVLASLYGSDRRSRTPAAGSSLRSRRRVRPARREDRRARRTPRQHADPEDHRRRARVRGDGRHAVSRHRDLLLGSRRAASLVRQRRPQRRRDFLPCRSLRETPRRRKLRDLQHLQHAEADAAPLRMEPVGHDHGLLRARPLQPHPGLAGPRQRRRHLLLPAQARRVEVLLHQGSLVLVLRRHGAREPREVRRHHLLPRHRRAVCEPLHPQRADVEGPGPRRPTDDTVSGRGPVAPGVHRRASGAPHLARATPFLGDVGLRRDGQRRFATDSTRPLAPTSRLSASGRPATPSTSSCRCRCAPKRCRAAPTRSRFSMGRFCWRANSAARGSTRPNATGRARRRSRRSPRWRCPRWSLPIQAGCWRPSCRSPTAL